MSSGAGYDPVTAPIPAEDESPISARKSPIPQALAILMEAGMILTSHCLIPSKESAMNIQPSVNTAARARR